MKPCVPSLPSAVLAAVLLGALAACGSLPIGNADNDAAGVRQLATEDDGGQEAAQDPDGAAGLRTTLDGTPIPEGTVIEDDFAPDSLPVSEGDGISVTGTLAYETYECQGTVECLILVLDEPFDAEYASHPNEGSPELHKGVTCIDVSELLHGGACDASVAGSRARVSGTFSGSCKTSGAHYDQDGTFRANGGCVLHDPVLGE